RSHLAGPTSAWPARARPPRGPALSAWPSLRRRTIEQVDEACSIMQCCFSPCNKATEGRFRMRFGVFILGDKPAKLSHREVFENVLEEARWAEEFGFDEV